MKNIKEMLPYLIVLVIAFFLIPLFINNTGAFMILLLVLYPVLCLCVSIMYGAKYGFNIIYVLIVTILFAITIFIYYNISAWVYIVAYLGITILGDLIGGLLKLRKKEK